MVLYADVLFLIDFSMDVLTLWATGRLTHSPLKALRTALAAALSAALSVAATAVGVPRSTAFILGAVLAFFMCIIAFGVGSFTSLIRRYVILWLGGILLGGIMTFLMSSGTMDVYSDALKSDTSPFAVIPAGILLLFISVRAVSSAPKVRFVTVTITFRKVKLDLRSMCDTGNLLEDPITGRPVIVICEKAARRLFFSAEYEYLTGEVTEIPHSLEGRTYVIPARSVSGDVLLRAVRPDSITVNGNERRALIAISEKLSGEAFEAVLSPKLL